MPGRSTQYQQRVTTQSDTAAFEPPTPASNRPGSSPNTATQRQPEPHAGPPARPHPGSSQRSARSSKSTARTPHPPQRPRRAGSGSRTRRGLPQPPVPGLPLLPPTDQWVSVAAPVWSVRHIMWRSTALPRATLEVIDLAFAVREPPAVTTGVCRHGPTGLPGRARWRGPGPRFPMGVVPIPLPSPIFPVPATRTMTSATSTTMSGRSLGTRSTFVFRALPPARMQKPIFG